MQTIGIFGGTFDPPHIGHLILAAEAYSQMTLDRLLWLITPNPPHKQGRSIAPVEHRLKMVELAIAGDPHFELSMVELTRPGPHYALDTMNILSEQNPGAQLVYLMGGDSLHDLPTWHRPEEFVAACHEIGVMRRPSDEVDLPGLEKTLPGITNKVHFIKAPLIEISASAIRARIAGGKPFRYFLPPKVYDYILKNGLYLH